MKTHFKIKYLLLLIAGNFCFAALNAQAKKTNQMTYAELLRKVQEKKDYHDNLVKNLHLPERGNPSKQFSNPRVNQNMMPSNIPNRPPVNQQQPSRPLIPNNSSNNNQTKPTGLPLRQ